MNARGGVRPGAGRPVGSLSEATKQNLAAQQALRSRILKSTDKLYRSQMALAEGCSFLYCVTTNKKGIKSKPVLITDLKKIEEYLQGTLNEKNNQEFYYISTKEPCGKSIDSLLDRVFGKAQQPVDLTTDGEKLDPLAAVLAAISGKTAGIPEDDK